MTGSLPEMQGRVNIQKSVNSSWKEIAQEESHNQVEVENSAIAC